MNQPSPAPNTLPISLLLHLAPGLLIAASYLALVHVGRASGLPSAAALGASALLVTGPLLLGILTLAQQRTRHGTSAIALRQIPRMRAIIGWATVIVGLAAAAFVVAEPVNSWVEHTLFSTWPDTWKPNLGTGGGYGDGALLWTAVLILAGSALVAPVLEEAYFRGFLLPRMPPSLGRAGPVIHTILFAAYHLWTPWLAPSRILGVLPLTYIALRTRSILPGIVAHITLNLIDVVVLVAVVAKPS
ncbi:MAG TPA: CPBP family intramembrane glutamic endopeptidase [Propionibacteriaceae bacterium]|nr:CPBP family intramembrane glutamic endopeptidase [Propionibacteriaceae bacterium]